MHAQKKKKCWKFNHYKKKKRKNVLGRLLSKLSGFFSDKMKYINRHFNYLFTTLSKWAISKTIN